MSTRRSRHNRTASPTAPKPTAKPNLPPVQSSSESSKPPTHRTQIVDPHHIDLQFQNFSSGLLQDLNKESSSETDTSSSTTKETSPPINKIQPQIPPSDNTREEAPTFKIPPPVSRTPSRDHLKEKREARKVTPYTDDARGKGDRDGPSATLTVMEPTTQGGHTSVRTKPSDQELHRKLLGITNNIFDNKGVVVSEDGKRIFMEGVWDSYKNQETHDSLILKHIEAMDYFFLGMRVEKESSNSQAIRSMIEDIPKASQSIGFSANTMVESISKLNKEVEKVYNLGSGMIKAAEQQKLDSTKLEWTEMFLLLPTRERGIQIKKFIEEVLETSFKDMVANNDLFKRFIKIVPRWLIYGYSVHVERIPGGISTVMEYKNKFNNVRDKMIV